MKILAYRIFIKTREIYAGFFWVFFTQRETNVDWQPHSTSAPVQVWAPDISNFGCLRNNFHTI